MGDGFEWGKNKRSLWLLRCVIGVFHNGVNVNVICIFMSICVWMCICMYIVVFISLFGLFIRLRHHY